MRVLIALVVGFVESEATEGILLEVIEEAVGLEEDIFRCCVNVKWCLIETSRKGATAILLADRRFLR
jgi:hypothetical protein